MLHGQPSRGPLDEPPAGGESSLPQRVLYKTLSAAVQVARALRIPLAELSDLLEMAYFHDAKNQGMKLHEIASLLGVSRRKASQLSSRLKNNFLNCEDSVELSRRIEFLLWAEPLSRARILRALPSDEETAIDEALEQLVREERVRRRRLNRAMVYERAQRNSRLVSPKLEARLDGLANAFAVLAAASYGRFFRNEGKALYRTIQFFMCAEDLDELGAIYREVWERIQKLEARAAGDRNALRMELSVAYAPHDYLREDR